MNGPVSTTPQRVTIRRQGKEHLSSCICGWSPRRVWSTIGQAQESCRRHAKGCPERAR